MMLIKSLLQVSPKSMSPPNIPIDPHSEPESPLKEACILGPAADS